MDDILKRSITKDDQKPFGNVTYMMLNVSPVPKIGLPVYWSWNRDYYLRQILYTEFHDFWSGAIGIAVTKMASLAWELESAQPRVRNYFQDMLLASDGNQSWVSFLARHLQDFLGTDNGAFIEVVRATQGAGSRILGLMHLDSLRCTRTGDPDIPILYRDTKGVVHEVKQHQVLMFADMPNSTTTYHGVGLCATSRAWGAIKKFEAIERYIYEKISGDRTLAVDLVGGVLEKDIATAITAAKERNESRGNTSYLGAVMIPVPSDVPLSHVRINFAELPDGFKYDEQVNNCILTFANSIGLDVQDLQPLTGRPLGSGEQSQVLADKAEGKGLAAWRQQFTHQVNQYILPDTVTFAFSEKDIRESQRKATVDKTNADTVGAMVEKQIISQSQALQMLADRDVVPQEFVPEDITPIEAIADTEKPEVEDTETQTTNSEEQPTDKEAGVTVDDPFCREKYRERIKEVSRRAP